MLTVGKIAVQRDFPLDPYAYPVSGIPSFEPVANPVDRAMVTRSPARRAPSIRKPSRARARAA